MCGWAFQRCEIIYTYFSPHSASESKNVFRIGCSVKFTQPAYPSLLTFVACLWYVHGMQIKCMCHRKLQKVIWNINTQLLSKGCTFVPLVTGMLMCIFAFIRSSHTGYYPLYSYTFLFTLIII
jgi:hypothetical protein